MPRVLDPTSRGVSPPPQKKNPAHANENTFQFLQHEFVSALSSWVPDPPHTTFEDPYPHQNDPDPQWKDPADALDPQLQCSTSEGPLFG